jgi:hypothetical protein
MVCPKSTALIFCHSGLTPAARAGAILVHIQGGGLPQQLGVY